MKFDARETGKVEGTTKVTSLIPRDVLTCRLMGLRETVTLRMTSNHGFLPRPRQINRTGSLSSRRRYVSKDDGSALSDNVLIRRKIS